MLRLCPHHGLEKWLIVHTFYNGLSYTTKMIVDAAAGGAFMNKNYTKAYALIEDMAQNHYQWTNERAITASSFSKKEADIHEVSNFDHFAAKVDALTLKFEKMNVSAVTNAPVSPLVKYVVYLVILVLIASWVVLLMELCSTQPRNVAEPILL